MKAAGWAPPLLWLVPALWSANYLIARAADGVIAPHLLALCRWLLALLLMSPWVARELIARWPSWRFEWPQLLVLGALGMWICGAFVYQGAQSTSAANIALMYAATPVGIAAVGVMLLHERMRAAQGFGVALALLVVLVALAALLPGVLSYGAYSFLQRELGASRTALMLYLSPVYSAFGAWLVLGERPGWYHAAGAALILPSIWLATRR